MSLRIVQAVRSDAFAGVERYIADVSNELARRGHHVSVVGGDPARMRQELDPAVLHTPAATAVGVWRATIGRGRTDIVHAHMTAAEAATLAASPGHRGRLICTRHFPDARLRALPLPVGRFIGRGFARQISISEFVARQIGEPSTVIPNGVLPREQATLEAPTILMLQRLQPEKAPTVGLEAWAQSKLEEDGWELLIAGSGALEKHLRELAIALGIDDGVSFLGHVFATDELFSKASALLAPAPAEPFGLSVVEAMARGIPVVAARGGAHVETLGEEGFLFAPGAVDEAAQCLRRLAGSLELRQSCGGRLRDRQRELFSLDRHVSSLEELYDDVLESPEDG